MRNSHGGAYHDQRHVGRTRIEMLSQLYVAAFEATQLAAEIMPKDPSAAASYRLRAISLVNAIESGLDLNQGDLPLQIQRLCHFVHQCLLGTDIEKMQAAARVLKNLSDGFSEIREEANRLEQEGLIPGLPTSGFETLA